MDRKKEEEEEEDIITVVKPFVGAVTVFEKNISLAEE